MDQATKPPRLAVKLLLDASDVAELDQVVEQNPLRPTRTAALRAAARIGLRQILGARSIDATPKAVA